jgi:hypothetical protein
MICLNCGCKLDLEAKFCPHCGKETPLNNENNIGKITIVREKKMLGFAIPFDVYIDDTKLGTLSNNSSLTTRSTLSMHEIKLVSTEKDVIENIELSEDKKEVTKEKSKNFIKIFDLSFIFINNWMFRRYYHIRNTK